MYKSGSYENRHRGTLYSARTILPIVLSVLPEIKSAVDLGCGVGTWLNVLMELGVKDILGIEGDWVDRSLLVVPEDCFLHYDLRDRLELGRRYDLAISLEVAEHIPVQSAETFINSITRLSNRILFSAAIPYQGGKRHENEQWPEYWESLFIERGFRVIDCVRRQIWHDEMIPFWYRQNALLFVHREEIANLRHDPMMIAQGPLSIVHPEKYLSLISRMGTIKGSLKILLRNLFASAESLIRFS